MLETQTSMKLHKNFSINLSISNADWFNMKKKEMIKIYMWIEYFFLL